MPTHVYQPRRNPPSWWDRLLVHPMDSTVGVLAFAFGALVAVSMCAPGFIPSKSMDLMPGAVAAMIGAFLMGGGVLIIAGLNWVGDNVSTGWALERFGWLVTAGGFLTYACTVATYYPESLFSWGVPAALGLGSLLRCWSIVKLEQHTRLTLAEVKVALRDL